MATRVSCCRPVPEPEPSSAADPAGLLRAVIVERLRSQQWRPGQRLPTERELGRQYGLSRSTVRRVLAEFKRLRLIRQTVGSGTYVADGAGPALAAMAAPSAVSPAELMAARVVLEPAIIDLVIGNATSDDFARMDHCLEQAEAAATLEAFEHWDARLHEAIAAAAHNGFVASVFRLMNEVRTSSEWGMLKRRNATPERRVEYHAEHRALVAALKYRDADRARALCLAHLVHVRTSMLGH